MKKNSRRSSIENKSSEIIDNRLVIAYKKYKLVLKTAKNLLLSIIRSWYLKLNNFLNFSLKNKIKNLRISLILPL